MALRVKVRGQRCDSLLKAGIMVSISMSKMYDVPFAVGVAYSNVLTFDFDDELGWRFYPLVLLGLILRNPLMIVKTRNGYHAVYCKRLPHTLVRVLKFLAWKLNFGDKIHNKMMWRRGFNVLRVVAFDDNEFKVVYVDSNCFGSGGCKHV